MNTPQFKLADFDAVAFDIEGTLADTIPTHHAARLQAFAEHGFGHITSEEHDLGSTYGSTNYDIAGGILHTAGHIDKIRPFSEHPIVQKVVATKDIIFDKLAAEGFMAQPGAAEFVKIIGEHFPGKVALVTAASLRHVQPFIEQFGLDKVVRSELIITDETVHEFGLMPKPSPDPYKLAKHWLQAQKLLVFEDTLPGIRAGKQAGATVIALGFDAHNRRLFLQADYPPDAVVMSYAEARQLLGL